MSLQPLDSLLNALGLMLSDATENEPHEFSPVSFAARCLSEDSRPLWAY